MQRRLDELHRRLQHHRHAEAARADARDGQPARITGKGMLSPLRIRMEAEAKTEVKLGKVTPPDDPDDGADDGDEDGEQRERQPQQPAQRPALVAVAAAAHDGLPCLPFPYSFACLICRRSFPILECLYLICQGGLIVLHYYYIYIW